MQDAEYVQRLRRHLSEYRKTVLRVSAGTWGKVPRDYYHILPSHEYQLNIVEPIRERFWGTHAKKAWGRHKYFHHLSSSQALAFNLFFPVFPELPKEFGSTRSILGVGQEGSAELDFEVVLLNAVGVEVDGTNIDVLITERDGRRTIIEIKLTEGSFGRARPDPVHLEKLRDTYRPLLEGSLGDECLEPSAFFREYQLFRQLAQIRPGSDDQVVLLLPRSRPQLWRFANEWCGRAELGSFRNRISAVALEDVAAAMSDDARSGGHDVSPFEAFAAKYLP